MVAGTCEMTVLRLRLSRAVIVCATGVGMQ